MQQLDTIERTIPRREVIWQAIRPWLTGRRGLIIGGLALAVTGLALGWSWLSAIGVAPVILSLAPCAAMCALGVCAMRWGNASGSAQNTSPTGNDNQSRDRASKEVIH
jgi:hypothetical protein